MVVVVPFASVEARSTSCENQDRLSGQADKAASWHSSGQWQSARKVQRQRAHSEVCYGLNQCEARLMASAISMSFTGPSQ
jgi:hypothetical protein